MGYLTNRCMHLLVCPCPWCPHFNWAPLGCTAHELQCSQMTECEPGFTHIVMMYRDALIQIDWLTARTFVYSEQLLASRGGLACIVIKHALFSWCRMSVVAPVTAALMARRGGVRLVYSGWMFPATLAGHVLHGGIMMSEGLSGSAARITRIWEKKC